MKKKEEEWAKTKEELEKLQSRYKELEEQNVDLLKSKNSLTLEVLHFTTPYQCQEGLVVRCFSYLIGASYG